MPTDQCVQWLILQPSAAPSIFSCSILDQCPSPQSCSSSRREWRADLQGQWHTQTIRHLGNEWRPCREWVQPALLTGTLSQWLALAWDKISVFKSQIYKYFGFSEAVIWIQTPKWLFSQYLTVSKYKWFLFHKIRETCHLWFVRSTRRRLQELTAPCSPAPPPPPRCFLIHVWGCKVSI